MNPLPENDASSTILVIEDNRDDQDMLIRQLKKSGVEDKVVCVADGHDALALVREGTRKHSGVCAIFLDLSLPGVNGLLLLEAIRSNVETALLPIFVMTGSTNPKDESECRRLGATSFIPKHVLTLPSFRSTIAGLFQASGTNSSTPAVSANSLRLAHRCHSLPLVKKDVSLDVRTDTINVTE